MSLILNLSKIFFGYSFLANDAMHLLVHYIRRYKGSLCLISGDISHHLILISPKITLFHFVISKYTVGKYFKAVSVSCFSVHFYLTFMYLFWHSLVMLTAMMLPHGDILFPSFHPHVLTGMLL